VKTYYIQVGVVVSEGRYEANTYEEARELGLKARAEMKEKFGHLGSMWYDIEELEEGEEE